MGSRENYRGMQYLIKIEVDYNLNYHHENDYNINKHIYYLGSLMIIMSILRGWMYL